MKVLSTKTLDPKTIAYAHSLNLDVQCIDFIKIEPSEFDLPNGTFDFIIFTSSNAVRFFFEHEKSVEFLIDKKILSLSGKTKEELLGNNIQPVFTADNTADLARLIIQTKTAGSVLHVCGNLALNVLEEKLKIEGIAYTQLIVYQTRLQRDIILNAQFDAIMFYSPSGVESFFTRNHIRNEMVCCCIGETTAISLKEKWRNAKIILPQHTSPESMIDAIEQYLEKTQTEL